MTRTARDDGRRPMLDWVAVSGRGKFKRWQLAGTKYFVQHCGHSTANFPWYGVRPDGEMITSGPAGLTGFAFRFLDDAKVACELDSFGRRREIGLIAAMRTNAAVAASRRASARYRRRRA